MIQTIIASIIGVVAFLYVGSKFINQFRKTETDPKCDNCPVPEILKEEKDRQLLKMNKGPIN